MRKRIGVCAWILAASVATPLTIAAEAKAAATAGAGVSSGNAKAEADEPSTGAASSPGPGVLATPSTSAWTIGLGPALYSDIFQRTIQNSTGVGGPQNPDRQRFGSSFVMNGSVWLLNMIAPNVRFGGALRWYGEYAGVNDNGNATTFGQLFDLAAHGEYLIDNVYKEFGVLFGARLGGTVLFPSGPGLDDDPNIDGPKFGFFGEPLAGIRWVVLPKLALRADTLVKFGRVYLYDTGQSVGGIEISTASHFDQFQVQWSLGVEFMP